MANLDVDFPFSVNPASTSQPIGPVIVEAHNLVYHASLAIHPMHIKQTTESGVHHAVNPISTA